jgi:2,3-bisphosphoglycerate-independent phosphoglycerate mutase
MSAHHKGLCIILDGLGDKPHQKLNHKTPLQAAKTPHFDALLKRGQAAMVHPLQAGLPVGTHTGTAVLFGLSPQQVPYLSRGPIEAAGAGVKLAAGDIAIRCNFATVKRGKNHFKLLDRRAGRIDKGVKKLTQALQNIRLKHHITASIHPATQHRAIIHLQGKNLSADISDTDPGTSNVDKGLLTAKALNNQRAAQKTADALNQLTAKVYQRLKKHPVNQKRRKQNLPVANAVISRGAGQAFVLKSLLSRLNLKVAVISGERTVSGLAKLLGYDCIESPRFTALANTDLAAKVSATRTALHHHDVVYLHIKATDICSHDHNPVGKKKFIEKVDKALKPLLKQKNIVMAVVSDHSTDCNSGRHCGASVPAILTAPHGRKDDCHHFDERHCSHGGLGQLSGHGFLLHFLDEIGCLRQFTHEMAAYTLAINKSFFY